MPTFGAKSLEHLASCDERLQRLFNAVIAERDCTVIEGHRTQACQEEAFRTGRSKKKWPDGMHCKEPSLAADVMEYPISWTDRPRIEEFAHFVLAKAKELDIPIRWGGDWNENGRSDDEAFFDGPHFELEQ